MQIVRIQAEVFSQFRANSGRNRPNCRDPGRIGAKLDRKQSAAVEFGAQLPCGPPSAQDALDGRQYHGSTQRASELADTLSKGKGKGDGAHSAAGRAQTRI